MKKVIIGILAVLMCVGFAACSSSGNSGGDGEQKQRIGMLTRNKMTEEEMSADLPFELTYFNNLSDMQMALTGGIIDRISIGESTAKYVISRANGLTTEEPQHAQTESYAMLLRKDDQALCDRISDAITKLKDNGTLAELQKKYIDGVNAGEEPEVIELPNNYGAETIKVAVSGDLPPMDYASVGGTAAGFNVALLKAISEELKVNIELVQVNAGARAMALSGGKADVIFWSLTTQFDGNDEMTQKFVGSDVPDNAIQTVAYYEEKETLVRVK